MSDEKNQYFYELAVTWKMRKSSRRFSLCPRQNIYSYVALHFTEQPSVDDCGQVVGSECRLYEIYAGVRACHTTGQPHAV
jgi:hypothetical protein